MGGGPAGLSAAGPLPVGEAGRRRAEGARVGAAHREGRSRGIKRVRGGGCGDGRGMAAVGALVKKAWSVRRFVVLLCAPLALVPILLSLPAKVPRSGPRVGTAGWGHPLGGEGRGHRQTVGSGAGERTEDAVSGQGPSVWSGVTPWELWDTDRRKPGCSVPPLASAPAVWLSRGSPCCPSWREGIANSGGPHPFATT